MLLAIADLAGGAWSKRGRSAALELEADRDEPSKAIRLFQALRDVWGDIELRLSENICAALKAHPSEEYADFRGNGAITPHQLAAVLRPFGIRSIHGLHPTGCSDPDAGRLSARAIRKRVGAAGRAHPAPGLRGHRPPAYRPARDRRNRPHQEAARRACAERKAARPDRGRAGRRARGAALPACARPIRSPPS